MSEREYKSFPLLECKSEENGRFNGYASTYAKDFVNDRIAPGAFAKSIRDQRGKVPILLEHSHWIGFSSDLAEDAKGLYIDGQIALDSTRGKDAAALLRVAKAVDYRVGLSIGYTPVDFEMLSDGVRLLKSIDLFEVSITPFPANPQARVDNYKSVRIIERILRDVGGCSGEAAKTTMSMLRPYLIADATGQQPPSERDVREQRNVLNAHLRAVMGES